MYMMEDSEVSEGSKDSIGADYLTFWLKNKVCFFFFFGQVRLKKVKKRLTPLMCKLCFAGTIDTDEPSLKTQCN